MLRIGALWQHGEEGIYHEHLATTICLEAIARLHTVIPPPAPGAPLALGGAPEGDPYMLPSLMAATVLADSGYRTMNLGANTPWGAFRKAVEANQPRLLWLAVLGHPGSDRQSMAEFLHEMAALPLEIVVGGSGVALPMPAWPASVHVLPNMEALAALAARRAG